jgi:polyhydroxybutyrate depolymerase
MKFQSSIWAVACMAAGLVFADALPSSAETITINGVQREYLLEGAAEKAKPLIIALHGGGGSAKRFRKQSGLAEQALASDFVIAFPDSDDGHWNDGRLTRKGELVSSAEDEAFILALVRALIEKGVAESTRIYITGHSNGGMMSFAMGCRHSNVFKAMAPVSANLPLPMACKGQGAIPVLNLVGLQDKVVPYDGGGIFGRKRRGELMSVPDTLDVMARRNGCTGLITTDSTGDEVVSGKSCTVETTQVRLKDQGHRWPKGAASRIVAFFGAVK